MDKAVLVLSGNSHEQDRQCPARASLQGKMAAQCPGDSYVAMEQLPAHDLISSWGLRLLLQEISC